MIGVVLGLLFYVQCGNGVGNEIHIDDVNAISRAEWQYWQACQEYESPHHIKLRGLGAPTVSEHNARTKDRFRDGGQELPNHVLAKFLGTSVGIIIGAVPIYGVVLGHDLILPLSGDGNRAHMTEAAEPVIVIGIKSELDDFEGATQVHI